MWIVPSKQPAINKGLVYEHYTECTYDFSGIAQTLCLPICQNDTSELPDPINKN
jgi:hypothetical protein